MHILTSNLLYIYQASDKEIPIKLCYIYGCYVGQNRRRYSCIMPV